MEELKHECGVAMIRLLKPLEYYQKKYGTWMYALNKLYLLMEKQHNRGQEGAGLACVKLQANPGEEYMFRERALGSGAITEITTFVSDTYGGMVRKNTDESTPLSSGDIKRLQSSAREIAMMEWELLKEYLTINKESYPMWSCFATKKVYLPKIYGVKRTIR